MSAEIFSFKSGKAAEREAVRWLLRLEAGPLDDAQAQEFSAWCAAAGNAAALEKARMLWRAAGDVAGSPEIARLRASIPARPAARRTFFAGAVAACLAVMVAGGLAFTSFDEAPSAIATTVGERATMTLEDGSVLILDTGSTAEVVFNQHERRVVLSRGQAMFEVAKEPRRPFVVYAGGRRVLAIGTAFNVRMDRAALEVTLVEGHVAVERAGAQPNATDRERTELIAGQRLIATSGPDAKVTVTPADIAFVTAWTTGKLVFLNTRLVDAVAEVNRYTRTPVVLNDSSLSDLRVSGVFRTGQTGEFARAVAQVYPVSIAYEDRGIFIAPQ